MYLSQTWKLDFLLLSLWVLAAATFDIMITLDVVIVIPTEYIIPVMLLHSHYQAIYTCYCLKYR